MIGGRQIEMGVRFVRGRLRRVNVFEVQAMLLHACNLTCAYCRCPEVPTTLMTTEQWREAIRGLASCGALRIKFQGGEPTLRQDFAELCRTARSEGMITAVTTNGVQIADDPTLLDGLDEVVVSLDSVTAGLHDDVRGAGTHEAAVRAIDEARERGVKTYVVMVVGRRNVDDVEAMIGFCEERGIRLHAQPIVFGRAPYDDAARSLGLDDAGVRALHHKLAEWKRAGRPLMFSAASYLRVTRWHDFGRLTENSPGPSRCMAGRDYVHVQPDGDVWPCHLHGATGFVPGNVVRDGVEAALLAARRHNCGDCFTTYLNERKAVFGLRPHALAEVLRRG